MKHTRLIPRRMQARSRSMIRRSVPHGAWAPIALTWRRAHRAFARAMRPPGRLAISCAWLPRVNVHLDFAVNVAGPTPRGALPARAAPAILWRRAGTGPSALSPIFRYTPPLEQGGHVHNTERQFLATLHWRSTAGWHEVVRLSRAAGVRPRSVFAHTVSENAATIATRRLPVPPALEMTRRRQFRAPAASRPAVTAPSLVLRHLPQPPGAERAARAAAWPLRGPDLIWRKEAAGPPALAAEPLAQVFAPSAGGLAAPAAPLPVASPEAIAGARQRMLDPALIDRLAEDVIGRVEKRIRIERERRGI